MNFFISSSGIGFVSVGSFNFVSFVGSEKSDSIGGISFFNGGFNFEKNFSFFGFFDKFFSDFGFDFNFWNFDWVFFLVYINGFFIVFVFLFEIVDNVCGLK